MIQSGRYCYGSVYASKKSFLKNILIRSDCEQKQKQKQTNKNTLEKYIMKVLTYNVRDSLTYRLKITLDDLACRKKVNQSFELKTRLYELHLNFHH